MKHAWKAAVVLAAVAGQFVAAVDNATHHLRMTFGNPAKREERGPHITLGQ